MLRTSYIGSTAHLLLVLVIWLVCSLLGAVRFRLGLRLGVLGFVRIYGWLGWV